eukprot:scaffold27695_cov64-Phaeocystis_antarctica.AAC.4
MGGKVRAQLAKHSWRSRAISTRPFLRRLPHKGHRTTEARLALALAVVARHHPPTERGQLDAREAILRVRRDGRRRGRQDGRRDGRRHRQDGQRRIVASRHGALHGGALHGGAPGAGLEGGVVGGVEGGVAPRLPVLAARAWLGAGARARAVVGLAQQHILLHALALAEGVAQVTSHGHPRAQHHARPRDAQRRLVRVRVRGRVGVRGRVRSRVRVRGAQRRLVASLEHSLAQRVLGAGQRLGAAVTRDDLARLVRVRVRVRVKVRLRGRGRRSRTPRRARAAARTHLQDDHRVLAVAVLLALVLLRRVAALAAPPSLARRLECRGRLQRGKARPNVRGESGDQLLGEHLVEAVPLAEGIKHASAAHQPARTVQDVRKGNVPRASRRCARGLARGHLSRRRRRPTGRWAGVAVGPRALEEPSDHRRIRQDRQLVLARRQELGLGRRQQPLRLRVPEDDLRTQPGEQARVAAPRARIAPLFGWQQQRAQLALEIGSAAWDERPLGKQAEVQPLDGREDGLRPCGPANVQRSEAAEQHGVRPSQPRPSCSTQAGAALAKRCAVSAEEDVCPGRGTDAHRLQGARAARGGP